MSQKIYKKLIQFVHFSTIFESSTNTFKDIYFLNNSICITDIEIFISQRWLSLKNLKFVEKTL